MSKYYIARDKDRSLWVYKEKPTKKERTWVTDYCSPCYKIIQNALFPDVQWEDEEPKVISIEESPWIKVEDRLPKTGEPVLCLCVMRTNGFKFYIVNNVDNNGLWETQTAAHYDIIAWMPIPEYKE